MFEVYTGWGTCNGDGVVSTHATREEAKEACAFRGRVRSKASMPRPSFEDAIADRGIVEAKAIKAFLAKLKREANAVGSRRFPAAGLTTEAYVRQYCALNGLKHP